jgi:hypothetical protein
MDTDKAIEHYKANIRISEAFYAPIAVLEICLRNSINIQLRRLFGTEEWYSDIRFNKAITPFQLTKIDEAMNTIIREQKTVTPGRIVAELSFGFWTSLFDKRFEYLLWKQLRLSFPACPKHIRQRRTISKKLNGIRKFRNRIFHHEPVSWSFNALQIYRDEIYQGIDWLDTELLTFFEDTFRLDTVLINEKISLTK